MIAGRNISKRRIEKSRAKVSFTAEIVLEAFCRNLSPAELQKVRDAVKGIAKFRRQIVTNMLAVGDHLNHLRNHLEPESFCRFMTDVLPSHGISRSTGYRWLGHAEKLSLLFPNPLVRQYLTQITDGRGIVGHGQKNGRSDCSRTALTPAAERAIRMTVPVPKSARSQTECEQWVRQFVKAMGKARSDVRSEGADVIRERDAIIERFSRFATRYGLSLAEELCGHMDKILNERTEKAEKEHFPPEQGQSITWKVANLNANPALTEHQGL